LTEKKNWCWYPNCNNPAENIVEGMPEDKLSLVFEEIYSCKEHYSVLLTRDFKSALTAASKASSPPQNMYG